MGMQFLDSFATAMSIDRTCFLDHFDTKHVPDAFDCICYHLLLCFLCFATAMTLLIQTIFPLRLIARGFEHSLLKAFENEA